MRRGELWFAATPGGDRPVVILTRDPVADRINFDNIHTLPRSAFRRRITRLSTARLHQACGTLRTATGC